MKLEICVAASKSILCFISINTKNVGKFWGNIFIVKKCISWAYLFASDRNFCLKMITDRHKG